MENSRDKDLYDEMAELYSLCEVKDEFETIQMCMFMVIVFIINLMIEFNNIKRTHF